MSAKLDGTYDGIYRTLKHILLGEQGYLRRITGHEPQDPLRVEHDPDLATLRHYARLSGEGLVAAVANITPSDSVRIEDDKHRWTVPASLIHTGAQPRQRTPRADHDHHDPARRATAECKWLGLYGRDYSGNADRKVRHAPPARNLQSLISGLPFPNAQQ